MKKVVLLFLVLALTILPVLSASAESVSEQLDAQAIAERFNEINMKYDIGEQFSEEDANFVRAYAIQVPQSQDSEISPQDFWTGKNKWRLYGIGAVGNSSTVETTGELDINIGVASADIIWNINARDINQKYHRSITNSLTVTAYGVVGSDGIGKTLDRTYSYKNENSSWNKFVDSDYPLANVAYYRVSAKTTVEDPGMSKGIDLGFTTIY